MHRLVVVVLVSVPVQANEGILEYLVDGRLASAGGPHTHEPVAHQLRLVQLDDFVDLQRGKGAGYIQQTHEEAHSIVGDLSVIYVHVFSIL